VSRALPSGQWVDSAGRWVGPNLEIEPYGARAVFKVASAPLAVKLSRASPSWMVHLQGRRLFFEGLTGLAVVYDERGRRLAQLVPDQTGKAALVVPAGSRWWVRTGQGTRSLVIP
ncbi:MAG TPA: hypothetical protein PKW90_26320, partial [Myxococcota bacterium]|nr:hypothetical protein [Myxococcota bacterium]